MNATIALAISLVLAATTTLPAQNVFHGNGVPSAFIVNTPAKVGQSLGFRLGSPSAPNGVALISLSGGLGPVNVPPFGLVGLDPFDPFYAVLLMFLDGNGEATLNVPLPLAVGNAASPAVFANALSVESGFTFSFSKTTRVEWANADGWEPIAPMTTPRQMHTATALGSGPRDNVTEVLICGGATGSLIVPVPMASAELFVPLTRTLQALPPMSLPRAGHRAERLLDGRVLITGGVTTGGLVTATCEFFDPVSATFVPAPAMGAPRASHAMTVLADGRVLVSGGVADWQNAATDFVGRLNTAQDTAELFDPSTNAWSPLPNMGSRRLGHSQTLLADGRVFVAMGINGGQVIPNGSAPANVPTFTASCQVFDPATLTFTATGDFNIFASPFNEYQAPRAFHGASRLPNGSVLITGGFRQGLGSFNYAAAPSAYCAVWNGTWSPAAVLPQAIAYHAQVPFANGALLTGGFIGDLTTLQVSSETGLHTGAAYGSLAGIGTDRGGPPQARAAHTCTLLHDGTLLVYGGGLWPGTLADGFIYTGN